MSSRVRDVCAVSLRETLAYGGGCSVSGEIYLYDEKVCISRRLLQDSSGHRRAVYGVEMKSIVRDAAEGRTNIADLAQRRQKNLVYDNTYF
jgi:hypothetical protein